MSIMLALRRPRQEILYKLKANLGLAGSFRPAQVTSEDPVSKRKKEESKREGLKEGRGEEKEERKSASLGEAPVGPVCSAANPD